MVKEAAIRGRITGIKRYEIHDGDGLRTTAFLKGCPLRCRWCHNPENLQRGKQLGYYAEKCIRCGACAKVCAKVHHVAAGEHTLRLDACDLCGKCAQVCPRGALTLFGEDISAQELARQLAQDKLFYDATGGGATLSGGEPLMQAEFCAQVLRLLKEEGVSTAVDTCLYAPRGALDMVLPFTDTFLVDIKAMDSALHKKWTGVENERILENILYLDGLGKAMEVRIPFIPGINDREMEPIAWFLRGLRSLKGVKVLAYHALSGAKYQALRMQYPLEDTRLPTKEEIALVNAVMRGYGLRTVEV